MDLPAPAQIRVAGRDAIHARAEHRFELANLQWAGLHWRRGYFERHVVPLAAGNYRRASKALCERYAKARAGHERSEKRRAKGPSGAGGSDGRNLLLKFRGTDHAG